MRFSLATSLALVLLASPIFATGTVAMSALEAADASLFERYVASHLRAYHERVTPAVPADQAPSFSSSPLAHGAASHLSHLSSLLENAHSLTAVSPAELGRKAKVTFRHAYLSATRPILRRLFPMRPDSEMVAGVTKVKRSLTEDAEDDHVGTDWSWLDGEEDEEEREESDALFELEALPSAGLRMEIKPRKRVVIVQSQ